MGLTAEQLYGVLGTILLQGETGVGKSFLANQIHQHSSLSKSKFLILNLATIKDELLESELFGHVRGAFTGAIRDRKGAAELVGDGTLFLDEIGEISLNTQKKFLQLIDENIFTPVGGEIVRHFRGRIIAATNKDLKHMVKIGTFREDLFFRLQIFSHFISPIRENTNKLGELINNFFEKYKHKHNKNFLFLSSECKEFLLKYPWPGNVREVRNCMEYLVSLAPSSNVKTPVYIENLPHWIQLPPSIPTASLESTKSTKSTNSAESTDREVNTQLSYLNLTQPQPHPLHFHLPLPPMTNEMTIGDVPPQYADALAEFEKKYFINVLSRYAGKINVTAHKIKISKATLISKAKKYGINTMLIRAKYLKN
ncbi:MAG: sigma-54-dependent Fis family transcriptional regulator [Oligoflexia bacterium]|nr:sigma-54-dependent Fis family transcriptional regulator [Oligoflexia bacterium]